jgi:Tol biopolymer transport system component
MIAKPLLICILILSLMITGSSAPQMQRLSDLSQKEGWVFLAYDNDRNRTYFISNGKVNLIYPKTDVIKELGLNQVMELRYPAGSTLSPDGNQIAYVRRLSAKDRDVSITIYNLRDNIVRDLIHSKQEISDLVWSPNGEEITFITQEDYDHNFRLNLRVVNVSIGRISELLPETRLNPASISWSPNDKELVFQAGAGDRQPNDPLPGIFVFNQENKTIKRLDSGSNPSWSPNGEFIAYLGDYFKKEERNNWYIMKPDGTNKQILFSHKEFIPSGQGFIAKLIWSPDMRYVIYHRTAGEQMYDKKTYLLDLKTKKRTEIHDASGLGIVDWRFAGR